MLENANTRKIYAESIKKECVTDITERKAKDGRLYVSAIFDCFDLTVLGLAMDDSMRAELCADAGQCGGVLSCPAGSRRPL
jgi:putative transposase